MLVNYLITRPSAALVLKHIIVLSLYSFVVLVKVCYGYESSLSLYIVIFLVKVCYGCELHVYLCCPCGGGTPRTTVERLKNGGRKGRKHG